MLKYIRFLMAAALLAGGLHASTPAAESAGVRVPVRASEACATPEWLGALRQAGLAQGVSQAAGQPLLPQEQVGNVRVGAQVRMK